MIIIDNISKSFEHKGRHKLIFKDASLTIPTAGNIAIIGADGSGKSVLINMMAGVLFPDSGNITIDEKISWPLGYKNSIPQNLTAREAVEFVAMVMQAGRTQRRHIHEFVQQFTQLDKSYDIPFKNYAKSMRARLNFAVCLAFKFDTYLMDDFEMEQDSMLSGRGWRFIEQERRESRFIFASKNPQFIKSHCHMAVLIKDKRLQLIENIDTAVEECKKMFNNQAEVA